MLIDFHTHVFPDAVAPKALASLKKGLVNKQGYEYPTYADGTLSGLLDSMDRQGVDLSIAMPVVTSAKQTRSINEFAKAITNDRVISFAGFYPLQDDWEEVMEQIKAEGFLGIKLHPEFQNLYLDSDRAIAILKKAEQLDLVVMLHAGEDPGVISPIYSSPQRLAYALTQVSGEKIIAAHMGGWNCWDDVEKHLIGKNVYLDTSMAMGFMPAQRCERLIKNHGVDKILFGSDSPWQPPQEILSFLKSMDLTEADLAKITHKNALQLLGRE